MAFKLDDIVVDRVQYGIAEDFDGNLLYVLTQLSDATIDVTAESKDAVDARGTLIKRFWQGKSGEFTANNAMINLNVLGAASGSGKFVATEDNPIVMPKVVTVKVGSTLNIKGFVEGTVKVNALYNNGTMGKAYTLAVGTDASETEFAINGDVLTPPVPAEAEKGEITQFIVKYDRKVTSGTVVKNKADEFPSTVKLTIKVLAIDPCRPDTLRAGYVEMPSFQVSPEVSVSLMTDTQLEYKGSLQVDYCSEDKELYSIYFAEDDEEE